MSDVSDWWSTAIIDMEPGRIDLRGHPVQELIGHVTFPQMIWLMVRGEMPSPDQAKLLECALVAAVDHGPQAPSIAAAPMAVTCGREIERCNGKCGQHARRCPWWRRRTGRGALWLGEGPNRYR